MTNRRSFISAAAAVGTLLTGVASRADASLAPASSVYSRDTTALLIVDPYNDFMTKGGKLYEATKKTADSVGFYENMRKLIPAVRAAGIQVFILPHHRSRPDDFDGWRYPTPFQLKSKPLQPFAIGTWGGEWNAEFGPKSGDIIVKEHWNQSSFANTDLDQQLKQHGIQKIVLVGFLANTCIESTGRFGVELGYHVTLVRDATGAFSDEGMHAAHEVNGPTFAHAIVTTADLLATLPSPSVKG